MSISPTAQAGTALSPEWDRGVDEAFAEIVSGDRDLVRAEFEAIVGAAFDEPPEPPAPPAPSAVQPAPPPHPRPIPGVATPARTACRRTGAGGNLPRSPPRR
ncbi:hypothetical protein [Actinoplanes sp. NPDC049118]|uniref:hypothetical protein n=1 Tax=Actinoplanes sp. NPDC049118 TaxID=3155769 RepID=UPI0033FA56CC